MERWIGSCRREILDRTLIWDKRHLLRVLREYETHHNGHRPHRSLGQAAPLKPLPDPVEHPEVGRVIRHRRIGGVTTNTPAPRNPDDVFGTHNPQTAFRNLLYRVGHWRHPAA